MKRKLKVHNDIFVICPRGYWDDALVQGYDSSASTGHKNRRLYMLMVAFLFYCPVGDSSSLHIEIDAHLHRR